MVKPKNKNTKHSVGIFVLVSSPKGYFRIEMNRSKKNYKKGMNKMDMYKMYNHAHYRKYFFLNNNLSQLCMMEYTNLKSNSY